MAYIDLNTINNPTAGQPLPAAWGDQVRDNFDFLVNGEPRVRAAAIATTINNNTPTSLPFTYPDTYDYGGIHSGAYDLFGAPIDGIYCGYAYTSWATNGNGYRRLDILANSSLVIAGQKFDAEASDPTDISVSWETPMSAGDYIQCIVHYNSSIGPSTLNIGGAFLTMRWVANK